MKTPLVHISCLVFLPLLLSPTARHASGSPIDWTNSCRPLDAGHWEADHPGPPAARSLAASAAAPARTVRLIYFIPNDRTFDSDVVDSIKVRIPRIRTFFRDQMGAHGHGSTTFQLETDDQGDPVVHRVDAPESDASYLRSYRLVGVGNVLRDLGPTFDAGNSILLIVVDHSTYNNLGWGNVAGFGGRWGKNSGYALLPASFIDATAAHELGHAFGLQHDFNDGANIMSYGPGWNRLSGCSAGFLAVHPYFDPDVPIEEQQTWDLLAPTVELASPLRYAAGSTSLSIQLRVRASGGRGLQQALFFLKSRAPHPAAGSFEVKACRDLRGAQDTVVAFSHDGVVPSAGSGSLSASPAHFVSVQAVDTGGNANSGPYRDVHFVLAEESPHHLATLFRYTRDTSPEIYGARFSPDGAILAVSSSAGIQIWNTAARAAVGTLSGGSSALAFSPDGATLASGSTRTDRANIKLWDLTDRTLIATLPGHTGGPTGVHSLAFSPSGDTLASGSGDQTIKLWDVADESLIATLTGHTSHVFSVAWSSDGTLASGSRDGTVRLWDAASQTSTASLEGNTGRVLDVAFSPDGSLLAASTDGPVLLWSVAAGDTIALQGHGEASFSADGATLVTGARLGEIVLWDVETAKSIARLGHPDRLKDASGFGINGVFSPDGSLLASVGLNGIELWDASEWTGAVPVTSPPAHPDRVALAALYNSTNGGSWQRRTNWLGSRPLGEWEGVRTNSLGRVYDLEVSWNGLKGPIPSELGNLTFLSSLYLHANQLSGSIPPELGNLSNLVYLELNHNRLSGRIPSELGNLSRLERLWLQSNQLNGGIPAQLGDLLDLTRLNLAGNQLSGAIPAELGNLTNLTSLGLSGNQLTGSIPAELGNLTNLTSLGLSDNQLTGSIPEDLEKLTHLTHLYLAGNRFTGCIPAGLRDVANNDLDTLGLSDCGQTQTQAATDFNGDGQTDFADFFKFIDAYGTTDARYDLDGNGTVDFADFFMFVDAFDQPGQGTKLVAMAREMLGLPAGPELHQSSPNPFNSETVISWFLLEPGPARVEVFSLTGQRLAVLRQGPQEAGFHRLNWDGRDHEGRPLGSGVYLYRLVTGETVLTRKLTLLR
ncbi:MAG: leucine-rich repeat domain-containing protein [Gemmatimonadaceae bacterium]|nr:leucine-rich repeat domain-containing protein [Gemmatimonadaceae bacterium]